VFPRFVALHYTGNVALGTRCDALVLVAHDLQAMAAQVRLLTQAAGVLEEEHGLTPPRRQRNWRHAGRIEVNEFLRSLARDVRNDLVHAIAPRWQQLKAFELLWAELASEFGGAGPVDPQFRAQAAALIQMGA
jgi:hypothetical protein